MAGGVWGAKVEALVKQQVCVGVWDHHSGVATCLSRTSRSKIAGSKPYNNQMRKMLAWCAQNVLGIVGAAQLKHYTSTLKSNFSITNWIKSNWSTNPSIHHGFVPWKESKYINQKQEKISNKCIHTWNLLILPADLFVHFICQKLDIRIVASRLSSVCNIWASRCEASPWRL